MPKRVHLTFDNGPHPVVTPYVLDVLQRYDLHATFFVLGKHLDTPEGFALAEQIRDAGHQLGNHSYSHEIPLGEDTRPDAVDAELQRTQTLLDKIWTGPRYFRPFGGGGHLGPHLLSTQSVSWLVEHQFTCVLWNSVPGDWKDPDGWLEKALLDIEQQDETVIVLHDILPDAMRQLDTFLQTLLHGGCLFTTEFPTSITPILKGRRQLSLPNFVNLS